MWPLIPERGGALRVGAAAITLCGACSPQQQSNEVDIADAARAAQQSVGNYVVGQTPASSAPAPVPTLEPTPTPTPLTRAADQGSAAAAAQVVRTYHDLIAQRRYAAAWQLWDRDGAASGLSAQAFAASFAKYRDYRAEVGEPGRIDAGAGQRYVTVPVTVSGTLRDGRPFTLAGPMTLHRSGDIDGASDAQRRWRLYDSGLKPRPATRPSPTPTIPDRAVARYRCEDGTTFRATFDNRRDTATLALPAGTLRLAGQRPASGIWYAGQGYELRGKGKTATLTRPEAPPLTCRAED